MLRHDGYDYVPDEELRIPTPNGSKPYRYADVLGVKTKTGETKMYQVGNTNKDGTPISREVRALDDIQQATGIRPQFESKDLASQIDAVTMRMNTQPSEMPEGPVEGEPIEPIEIPF